MNRMQNIYIEYMECIVRIISTATNGDIVTGAGFHIGQGYFVTARHVVEGFKTVVAQHIEGFAMIDSIEIKSIIFPSDKNIDIAILQTSVQFTDYYLHGYKTIPGKTLKDFKGIPFGALTDKGISDDHILNEVLLMGFPRIPLSDGPELVAVRGEINATIKKYIGPTHCYHIVSTVARGGFSGGPVIDEDGFLIGIFTESLTSEAKHAELGFAAAVSIEPLLLLLKKHKIRLQDNLNILIKSQANVYDDWHEKKKADIFQFHP